MHPSSDPSEVFQFYPRCGSAHFQAISLRAKKCSTCSFSYYFNASAAVAALIFDRKGKLMLTRRAINPHIGMLDLPGGFIEPMESAEDAVRRELMEELGVEVTGMEYLVSFPNEYPFSGMSVFTLDMAFRVSVRSFQGIRPMDDIASFEFYEPDAVPMNEIAAPSIRQIVEWARVNIRGKGDRAIK